MTGGGGFLWVWKGMHLDAAPFLCFEGSQAMILKAFTGKDMVHANMATHRGIPKQGSDSFESFCKFKCAKQLPLLKQFNSDMPKKPIKRIPFLVF